MEKHGAIMGVPPPRSAPSSVLYVNKTRYDQEIGNTLPKTSDDWKRILVQLTNPQADHWAIAAGGAGFGFGVGAAWYPGMFGAPNTWQLVVGGAMLAVILFLPEGLWSLAARVRKVYV